MAQAVQGSVLESSPPSLQSRPPTLVPVHDSQGSRVALEQVCPSESGHEDTPPVLDPLSIQVQGQRACAFLQERMVAGLPRLLWNSADVAFQVALVGKDWTGIGILLLISQPPSWKLPVLRNGSLIPPSL